MQHKRLKLSTVLMLVIVMSGLQAQEAISAAGGDASSTGGSVSYSVGQVVYTTITGSNGSVVQGVQQPYEISIVIGIDQARDIKLSCTAYPNPVVDLLTLKVDNYNIENLMYQLYDMNGKRLENKFIKRNETGIPLGKLVPATYFLKVIHNGKEVKTFKIIKN